MIVLYSFLISAGSIGLFFLLYYSIKYIIEKIAEWVYRRRQFKQCLDKFTELYSSYLNLQIQNCILSEDNLKLEKDNIRLRNRVKKLKGEMK